MNANKYFFIITTLRVVMHGYHAMLHSGQCQSCKINAFTFAYICRDAHGCTNAAGAGCAGAAHLRFLVLF